MLTFNEAQIWAWLSPLLWPFVRILALFGSMPVFAQRAVPVRVRVALAMLITVCAQGTLPPMPVVALDSSVALLLLIQQLLIGLTIGFAVRLVFAAIELAGELTGLQMGMNFAGFFDPASGGQTTVVSRFYGVCISWLFIVINGHLLLIAAVVRSFEVFPVGPEPFAFLRAVQPHLLGAEVFRLGLWIALPMIAMLMFTNLVLGIISRVAQQLQIFAIGFPITVSVGLLGVMVTLPMLAMPFTNALEQMLALFR
ncbi:flagellar biosynthetic protein FliR [Piscinibacter sakaiensis]|uniref:flagellar biosynthetic protein FliR n=1 Tax=Piscinibacter sakaiensis TaxID=1547922 RepID=UPI003AAF8A2F